MNKNSHCVFSCFVFLITCISLTGATIADPAPVERAIPDGIEPAPAFELVQRGIAQPGSALHEWLNMEFGMYEAEFPISYEFKFSDIPEDPGLLDIEAFAAEQIGKSRSPSEVSKPGGMSTVQSAPAIPEAPVNPGTSIGDEWTYHSNCWNAGIGYGFAEVTAVYNWEYTSDTNGDGEYDSNPEWVLQSVEFTFYFPNQPPPSCL